ncbi:FkbM family methyltransferase [Butyricicoccus faecihominis]|uniref:FkbM family methyltransferase n=1 Tax=Butyricicoccus faecihominis TaxID=1712515 RepID=UPI002478EE09|nr:FkbM family methyltransferase [Butyricicoccus faecihominis]MCQ5128155.1 FkbM family methyltransferase [Butyricicoccus faecihominis]
MDKYKILVCCHKETPYIKDSIFTPILLGSAYAGDATKRAFQNDLWDNMGDNISELQPYCAELSAIYWAWKNYDVLGNPDFLGLFHYRRFFNFSEPIGEADLWKCAFFDLDQETCDRFKWNREGIEQFCLGYDLILPYREEILNPKDWKTSVSLETHYKNSHYPADFDRAIELVCKTHPQYKESVQRSCAASSGHFCNMFIMTRQKFFDYATWLFSIIFPLKDILHVESSQYTGINVNQKRVLGFLGERLFNVWIDYQKQVNNIKIRETERVTGYLTQADRLSYIKKYGINEYKRAVQQSKRNMEFFFKRGEDRLNSTEMLVHDSRNNYKPAVSVLLPVYNVGQFLRPCIESLINQTLEDMEFIFVYDDSQDNSLNILVEYYQRDCRIVIIENKQRGGMSRARNIAMQFIKGEYFAFVDSDDICDVTMFEKLYQKAKKLDADITTCSVWGFYDTMDNKYLHRQLEWFADSDKLLPLAQRPQQLMEPAAWCKLFRTKYIQSLDYFEFRPDVVSWEDVPAMTSAFTQTDRIATVQEALYYYRQRTTGNLSNLMTKRYIDEFISGAKLQGEILKRHGSDDWMLRSYIEEFKCLFAEWMLSKLDKKDRPYFFHHVGCLFKFKERHYLHRLFTLYPKRRLFYYVIVSRSCAVYYFGKVLLRARRSIKALFKKTFDIKREGIYRSFKIGPLRFKQLNRSYCSQTVDWLEKRSRDFEDQISLLQAAHDDLKVCNAQLQGDNRRLERANEKLTVAHANLQTMNAQLEKDSNEIKKVNNKLEEHNDELQAINTQLCVSNKQLQESNDELQAVNSELRTASSHLQESNKELQLKSENLRQALSSYEKMAGGFYYAVWTTGWVDIWKQYYYENFKSIPQKTNLLKEGLDDTSCALIDRLCYRNFELLPKQADSKLFLYDHRNIYTAEELSGAENALDEEYFREKYIIPEDEYLEIPVFAFNCGIPFLPESVIKRIEGRDIIDGGAYWGDSALVLHEYKPEKIYAFEPQPETFLKLNKTIIDNRLENDVVAICGGLGVRQEVRPLYTNGMMSGSNLMNITPSACDDKEIVNDANIFTIDSYVKEHALNVGLIKLDIEGNELAAIYGAEETIKKFRPILDIAIYHHPQDFFEIKPFIEKMNLGYHFLIRKLVYHDLVTEVVLLGYPDGGFE